MDEIWTQIVTEALERGLRETKGRPVPGAKLRKNSSEALPRNTLRPIHQLPLRAPAFPIFSKRAIPF